MFFSVLIPVYNVEKYLNRCIRSVLDQSLSDYEIILVDDGSTDRSGEICDFYANRYDMIRTIHKKNDGLYMARYDAIKVAKGEYLVFLDSDDTIDSDALSILQKVILDTKSDMIVFRWRMVDNDTLKTEESETLFQTGFINYAEFLNDFLETKINNLWAKCIRNKLVSRISVYHHFNMAEDAAYTCQFVQKCKSIYYISDVLYNYHINYSSIVHRVHIDHLIDSTIAHYETLLMLQSIGCPGKQYKKLVNKYIKDIAFFISELDKEDIRSSQMKVMMFRVKNSKVWMYCNNNKDWLSLSNKVFLNLFNHGNYVLAHVIGLVGLDIKEMFHKSNGRKMKKEFLI